MKCLFFKDKATSDDSKVIVIVAARHHHGNRPLADIYYVFNAHLFGYGKYVQPAAEKVPSWDDHATKSTALHHFLPTVF